MALTNVTSAAEFKKHVLENDKLVLVDFWAQWCPPCRMMAPILEKVAEGMKDDIDIVKIDVEASDDNGKLAAEYEVQGIPNLQVFKDGKVVDQLVGMRPQAVLEDDLKKHL
ncbi:thioredoxin [Candidatus Saccharibacteria bacterium]|nr:MAG: thioredoxin [Candidatus Saccharibacteria bacterium]